METGKVKPQDRPGSPERFAFDNSVAEAESRGKGDQKRLPGNVSTWLKA